MGKIFFVIIGLLILLRVNSIKKRLFTPSSFLIFIYLISTSFCVLDVIVNDQNRILLDKYWPSAIVFLILISGFLLPYIRVNELRWKEVRLPSIRTLTIFSDVIIALSLFSIGYFITDVITVFSSGDLSGMREHLTGTNGEYTKTGVLNTIASVSASFYDIALLLFFLFYALGCNKKRQILLIISSFSYTVQVLTFVGRDGVVFWVFSFIFDFLLFRDFIPSDIKKKLKSLFVKVAIVISIPFLAISISRFGESDTGTSGGLITYIGQPLYHWCMYHGMDNRYSMPGAGWPLYYEITGKTMPVYSPWEADGTNSWVFGTFLKSWLSSIGMIGIIGIMLFMWILFILVFPRTRRYLSFHSLFIYILFFEIIAEGVFYFLQYTRGGNLTIVLMFFFFFVFGFIEKNGKKVVLRPQQ